MRVKYPGLSLTASAVAAPLHARLDFATDIFRTVADQQPRVIWGDGQEMLLHTRRLSRPAVREVDVRILAYFEIVARFDGGGKSEIRQQLARGRRQLRVYLDAACVEAQYLGQPGDNAHSAAPFAKASSRHRPQGGIDDPIIAGNEVETIDRLAAAEPLVDELRYRLRHRPNGRNQGNFAKHGYFIILDRKKQYPQLYYEQVSKSPHRWDGLYC